jgi:hypothetical protein
MYGQIGKWEMENLHSRHARAFVLDRLEDQPGAEAAGVSKVWRTRSKDSCTTARVRVVVKLRLRLRLSDALALAARCLSRLRLGISVVCSDVLGWLVARCSSRLYTGRVFFTHIYSAMLRCPVQLKQLAQAGPVVVR